MYIHLLVSWNVSLVLFSTACRHDMHPRQQGSMDIVMKSIDITDRDLHLSMCVHIHLSV